MYIFLSGAVAHLRHHLCWSCLGLSNLRMYLMLLSLRESLSLWPGSGVDTVSGSVGGNQGVHWHQQGLAQIDPESLISLFPQEDWPEQPQSTHGQIYVQATETHQTVPQLHSPIWVISIFRTFKQHKTLYSTLYYDELLLSISAVLWGTVHFYIYISWFSLTSLWKTTSPIVLKMRNQGAFKCFK